MFYEDGNLVCLGDVVSIEMPSGKEIATVMMLGEDLAHLEVEASYLTFLADNDILKPNCIVVKWVGTNPQGHDDPNFAPVADYMTTGLEDIQLIRRLR